MEIEQEALIEGDNPPLIEKGEHHGAAVEDEQLAHD